MPTAFGSCVYQSVKPSQRTEYALFENVSILLYRMEDNIPLRLDSKQWNSPPYPQLIAEVPQMTSFRVRKKSFLPNKSYCLFESCGFMILAGVWGQ